MEGCLKATASVPPGNAKCCPWVRPHHRRMKGPRCFGPREITFIELHFGIWPLPCLMGLEKKPHETQYCLSDDGAKSWIHEESLQKAFSLCFDYRASGVTLLSSWLVFPAGALWIMSLTCLPTCLPRSEPNWTVETLVEQCVAQI